MTLEWVTAEEPKGDVGAYAHWWAEKERDHIPDGVIEDAGEVSIQLPELHGLASGPGGTLQETFYTKSASIPLPKGAGNEDGPVSAKLDTTKDKMPKVPDDTVLVGIVDTGISLCNSRFRMADGKTRFISSWQQSARFTGQADLHCGQEIYESDIQEKLDEFGPPGALGYVDETEFNRALFLTEPLKPGGQRDLERAAAHGTHVLDLAAGLDPKGDLSSISERLRLIAVNLPAQYAHGSAGAFLPYFAVSAVDRIIHIAEALWEKNNPGKPGGYPLVINFSYGMTAGPKDGNHLFETSLAALLESHKVRARGGPERASPVRVVMPAGNDNLSRSAASIVLGAPEQRHSTGYRPETCVTLPWNIKPADATANFLEIWLEALPEDKLHILLEDFTVSVSPPGQDSLLLKELVPEQYQNLGNFARAYVNVIDVENGPEEDRKNKGDGDRRGGEEHAPKKRIGLLICVAPTTLDVAEAPLAPAGTWTVQVIHKGKPVDVAFYIQSDQSAVRGSKTGKRSYFDHENYKRFLDNGAQADTYSYEQDLGATLDNDNWSFSGPVQRRGTHNALASMKLDEPSDLVVVGGYDDSFGYPANYSSSCDGNRTKKTGREALSVSYPSENAPSLFGLIASGARDGSVTAYRGTSMATALATRDAAFAFLGHRRGYAPIGTERWFQARSKMQEDLTKKRGVKDHWGQMNGWPKCEYLKSGTGRIPSPGNDRLWHRLSK